MRKAAWLSIGFTACLAVPAQAQREVYEPQYEIAYERLTEVNTELVELDAALGNATDLVTGCTVLRDTVSKLQEAEGLLEELVEYSERLDWRRQRESYEERLESVQGDITLRQTDMENNSCADYL